MWEASKKGFKAYLRLEKSLSDHSVEAYMHDVNKLTDYLQANDTLKSPQELDLRTLQHFVKWITELGITAASQARIISGIRAFYRYCMLENIVTSDPSVLLEAPKLKRILPDTLSFEEIENIIAQIDVSTADGSRNKAILETMYSCGLRVTEVISLKMSCLYFDVGFIRVIGKGDKEVWHEIDCISCANCCKQMTPTFTRKDIRRISDHLEMKPSQFKKRWLYKNKNDKDWVNINQPCQFLDLSSNMCSIYEVRPADCAGFPHLTKKKMADYIHVHQKNIDFTVRLLIKWLKK